MIIVSLFKEYAIMRFSKKINIKMKHHRIIKYKVILDKFNVSLDWLFKEMSFLINIKNIFTNLIRKKKIIGV